VEARDWWKPRALWKCGFGGSLGHEGSAGLVEASAAVEVRLWWKPGASSPRKEFGIDSRVLTLDL
jgi:hypothetical protein